jgi:UDP-N-acetylmuramate--alanine ligase
VLSTTGTLGMRPDLSRPRRVHVVGVGGAGMSGIATVLAATGHRVSGSDLKWSAGLERLRAVGVEVHVGHDPAHLGEAEIVTASTAVAPSNPELAEARRRGLACHSRSEVLAALCATRRCVAVSGTHGKTTTTSMLALVLVEAGLHPSFLVGGDLAALGTNAVWGSGQWLVVEADESDGTFLALDPELAVVTNIEVDHLDHYGSFEALVEAFDRFCTGRPLGVVAGADDPTAAAVGRRHGAVLVGSSPEADVRLEQVRRSGAGVSFELWRAARRLGRIELPVAGANIAQNAAVATAAAMAVGAPFEAARAALARFAGVARRYEQRGERNGVRFVDDYAHLPTEVSAVLEAAAAEGRRLVVVFQPHRYSRTAALGTQFARAFDRADVVVVTDVFAAGEAPLPGVSGRVVADAVRGARPGREVHYVAGRGELAARVAGLLRPGDLCLTLGAGDLTSLPDELMEGEQW